MRQVECVTAAGEVLIVARLTRIEPIIGGVVDSPKAQGGTQLIALCGMIVDDIKNDLDAGVMQPRNRGAEIVERVRSRAQIHRLLHRVQIDTQNVPEPGAKLYSGSEDAGEIASAVFSPSLDKVVALAYVRIRFTAPGSPLSLANAPAILA